MFKKASADLDPKSDHILDKASTIIGEGIKENIIHHIVIEGFTSSEGNPAKNKALSQARAESVVKYLEAHGIPKGILIPRGFGPENPIAPNDTEENR